MKPKTGGAAICLLLSCVICAQAPSKDASYDELIEHIELHQGGEKVWLYLNDYLAKAKREHNKTEIVNAYKEMQHECAPAYRLVYADSMIMAARESKIPDLIGASYLSRGIIYYQQNRHQQALDNYILANKYLSSTKDAYLKHKVKYSIAQIKYYLGYYHEAIALFRECIAYFKDKDPLPYLKSLHCLTICYTFTGEMEKGMATNSLTVSESVRLGVRDLLPYADSALGVIYYNSHNYRQAIRSITYALPQIHADKDFANEAIAHFYLGGSYWAIGRQDAAIDHFKTVDTIFNVNHYLRPDLRQAYEYLIKYYHHKDMPDEELKYINQLLLADSLLSKEFIYMAKKVHKEYDTAELVAEKKKVQAELRHSRWSGLVFKGLLAAAAVSLLYILYRHQKLKKTYRKRFEELIKNDADAGKTKLAAPKQAMDINPIIVGHILEKITDFENRKGYLKKDIDATKLAKAFGTNYKYLSRVIRLHRDNGYTNYINSLRVDYMVARLKEEPLLRRYANAALAEEAGFSTTQHFTKAFKKRTGISPGYFVGELNKIEPTHI